MYPAPRMRTTHAHRVGWCVWTRRPAREQRARGGRGKRQRATAGVTRASRC